jgi:hypothetical protein
VRLDLRQRIPAFGLQSCLAALVSVGMVALIGCGSQPTDHTTPLSIITPHETIGSMVQWDPNDEPVLILAVGPEISEESITWRQRGLSLAQPEWTGPVMRLHIDSPGCGYGGHTFTVTATVSGPDSMEATIDIDMAKYMCPGSPWLSE